MLYANLLLNVLYHIEIEMKIRESCLQTGNFIYKPGISLTKQDFHLQRGSLGLQRGFSGYYLPLNIRTDKAIKDQAEEIFNELGLNMTTAINIFLRTAIREHGIPFELKLEVPNDTTAVAIEEGRKMMKDPSAPRYSSMDALKAALDV